MGDFTFVEDVSGMKDESRQKDRNKKKEGLCFNITSYLLWRWSVKVMVVQRDRGMVEQKDTLQIIEVTLASWFWMPTSCLYDCR